MTSEDKEYNLDFLFIDTPKIKCYIILTVSFA